MFYGLSKIGTVMIDGILHYVYARKAATQETMPDLYLVSTIGGAITRVERSLSPNGVSEVVDKAVKLLDIRLADSGTDGAKAMNEVAAGSTKTG